MERTLAIIKPDAMEAGHEIAIVTRIQDEGFVILDSKTIHLDKAFVHISAKEFYMEHKGRPFYKNLVAFMSRSPVRVMVLAATGAIKKWRTLLGPTNATAARTSDPKSIRALYGTDNTQNACHGSDSIVSATREIRYFFPHLRIDPLPSSEEAKLYLQSVMGSVLTEALVNLCKVKPQDPISYLGQYLIQHNPNAPRISNDD